MIEEKERILMKYCESLGSSGLTYDTKGKYMEAATFFLNKAEEVGKRGYVIFCRQNAEYMAQHPWTKPALCHFLESRGVGFRKAKQPKQKAFDPLKKLGQRQNETLNKFVFWLQNQNSYSTCTVKNYADGVKKYFSYFDELTQENCVRFLAQQEKDGLKPATIAIRTTALMKLSEFLKKPIKLKRVKIPRTLHTENVPTAKEYQRLLEVLDCNDPKYAFMVRLMGTTGCRVSELLQFRYEDVANGSVELKGKGNKYRRFFFTKEMQNAAKGRTGLVCINRYGGPLSSRGLSVGLKKWAEKAGIDRSKIHPHAFRHFFAKMYLQKTNNVVELSEILGHDSVDTTRIYLQKSYDEQKRDFNRAVTW